MFFEELLRCLAAYRAREGFTKAAARMKGRLQSVLWQLWLAVALRGSAEEIDRIQEVFLSLEAALECSSSHMPSARSRDEMLILWMTWHDVCNAASC